MVTTPSPLLENGRSAGDRRNTEWAKPGFWLEQIDANGRQHILQDVAHLPRPPSGPRALYPSLPALGPLCDLEPAPAPLRLGIPSPATG